MMMCFVSFDIVDLVILNVFLGGGRMQVFGMEKGMRLESIEMEDV